MGLLILIGVGLFGGLVLWLRGLNPGQRSYQIDIIFEDTLGMQAGTAVRYRGVPIGRVLAIDPDANAVRVRAEITEPNLLIPNDVRILANQSGLIGETTVDMTPTRLLNTEELAINPTVEDCDSQLVICNGDVLQGEVGASYEALLRSAEELANAFADPEIIANLKTTLENATEFTESATVLTSELTVLTESLQGELPTLTTSARRATDNVAAAATEVQLTATDVRSLIAANRASIDTTLTNLSYSSNQLVEVANTLSPAIRDSQFLQNLEILSADAAAAAANIRTISEGINTPENLLMLQQTLDSARNVFLNAQKVLADVDELTGDPTFRNNLRDLVNGLTDLVSTTESLEQQVQLAQWLTPAPGQPLSSLSLTAVPTGTHPPSSPDSILLTRNGQLYQLQQQPSRPAAKP